MKKYILLLLCGIVTSIFAQNYSWSKLTSNAYGKAVVADEAGTVYFVNGGKVYYCPLTESVFTLFGNSSQDINFSRVLVTDSQNIIGIEYNNIYHYNFTSQLWDSVYNISSETLTAYDLLGDTLIFVTDKKKIHASYDDGLTWKTIPIAYNPEYPKLSYLGNKTAAFGIQKLICFINLVDSVKTNKTFSKLTHGTSLISINDTLFSNGDGTGIFFSTDMGDSWIQRGYEPTYNLDYDYDGKLWRIGFGAEYSTDMGLTWQPANFGGRRDNIIRNFDIHYPVKFIERWGFFRSGAPEPGYVGENYLPLEVGNRYLYRTYHSSNYFGNIWKIKYSTVTESKVVNGHTYFNFDNTNVWYRYAENKITSLGTGEDEYIVMNFEYENDAVFYQKFPSDPQFMNVNVDSVEFHGVRNVKGINNLPIDEYYQNWAEGIGLISTNNIVFGWPYGSSGTTLAECILKEGDNSTYYKSGKLPHMYVDTIRTVEYSVKFSVDPYHEFDFEPELYPFSFIDSVIFDYRYVLNGSVIPGGELKYLLNSPAPFVISIDVSPQYITSNATLEYRIRLRDKALIPNIVNLPTNGWSTYILGTTVSVDTDNPVLNKYHLSQNYPNPFNPETKISYSLKEAGNVELIVYDVLGNEVATLVSGYKPAGVHEVNFNAAHLPSGVYIYKIMAGSFTQSRKMIMLK